MASVNGNSVPLESNGVQEKLMSNSDGLESNGVQERLMSNSDGLESNGVQERLMSNSDGLESNGVIQEKLMLNSDDHLPTPVASSPPPTLSSTVLCTPPCRLVFAIMGFFCFFNLYSLRVNLSVALVQMVNITYMKQLELDNANLQNATIITDDVVCETDNANRTRSSSEDGPFNWDSRQQGILLSALFYGYIFTQIPGGMLAERFGGKLVLLVGISWTAFWTILTPVIAEAGGFIGLVAIRILEGIGEGVAYPAMHVMLSSWAPPLERGRMATFIYAGAQIGTVITMPASGVLCQMVNWQSVFYVFGAIGIVWSVLWIFLVYDKPSVHPRITLAERTYIETSQGPQRAKGVMLKTPWLKMAKSPAVYALMAANFSHNWGNFFLITVTPQFLSYILKFDVKSSGIVSGAPYVTMWMGMLLGGTITDFLLSRHLMPVTWVRKLFVIIGFVGPAVCLVGTGYVNCERGVAIAMLVISGACIGLSWGGWGVNHLDIAPPFAGTLFGVTNCISTIPGFVAPAIVGALTYRNQTRVAWRGAFYITAAVLLFGTLVFLICGTGKRQKWSYPESMNHLEDGEAPVLLKSTKKDEELGESTKEEDGSHVISK